MLLSFDFLALGCWLCCVCVDGLLHQRAFRGRRKPLNLEQQATARVSGLTSSWCFMSAGCSASCRNVHLLCPWRGRHPSSTPCRVMEWPVYTHRQGSHDRKSCRAPRECYPVSESDGHKPSRGLFSRLLEVG